MTGMEFIPELIGKIDPVILEAATKGLATAIGKVAGESGIKLLGGTGEQILDSAGKLTKTSQDLLFRISRKYIENYTERHGILKVLGMPKPVSLDSVYTAVKLLNPEELRTFESVEALESEFRKSSERGFRSRECSKQSGITVANQEQYLMVLGSPGMGKTTFLRKVGLEALKRNKGDYTHNCIPVLLELKTFRTGEIDFENAIATEFQNCGLPEYQQLTNKFLEQGKLLILLDGLDEVPTERIGEIVTKIQDFVDRRSKNRFITSCRIAAYRNNFRRFTDVAIADFDDGQIENFITNWFVSNPEQGRKCWAELNDEKYVAAKELAQTPFLLTLICLNYRKNNKFPQDRIFLFERAFSILLKEWDIHKSGVLRDSCYKRLNVKLKEILLAEIAFNSINTDILFLRKHEIIEEIESILFELLPDEKFIDGSAVLKDIEIQHGLLIERASDRYSFSHLSIQEHLAAKYICIQDERIEYLIESHLCEQRWREIFLSVSGLNKKADSLLLTMEKQAYSFVNTPKLNSLLFWVEEVANKFKTETITSLGKRAIALYLALTLDLAEIEFQPRDIYSDEIIHALAYLYDTNTEDIKIKIALDRQQIEMTRSRTLIKAQNLSLSITGDIRNNLHYFLTMIRVQNFNNIKNINPFTNYIQWSQEFKIYRDLDYSKLLPISDEFDKMEKPDRFEDREIDFTFMQELVKSWQQAFKLNPEILNFTESEMESLDDFVYANLLLVECKKAAARVSPDVWEGIESRMLLPVENA